MPAIKQYTRNKELWATNNEDHLKEKKRINEINKSRYANDPEYRQKCKDYQRLYNQTKKEWN